MTDSWMFMPFCFYRNVHWGRKENEPPGDCGFADDMQEQFVDIVI